MFGDAAWVLLGAVIGCVIALGAIWLILRSLRDSEAEPTGDGDVPFVVHCQPGAPCYITSVPDQTPTLAVKGKPGASIDSPLQPDIADLGTGDRVVCTVHIKVLEWSEEASNGPEPKATVKNCRRA
ncbi:hypothetical protein [Nocardia sp. NPDC004860]|uniref:hypothetical protein n=1 Tax=Nocardia sp. NPDC004860 TaxID=3154557 RepID=UPI0033B3315D